MTYGARIGKPEPLRRDSFTRGESRVHVPVHASHVEATSPTPLASNSVLSLQLPVIPKPKYCLSNKPSERLWSGLWGRSAGRGSWYLPGTWICSEPALYSEGVWGFKPRSPAPPPETVTRKVWADADSLIQAVSHLTPTCALDLGSPLP